MGDRLGRLPAKLTMGQWGKWVNKSGWVTWVTGQLPDLVHTVTLNRQLWKRTDFLGKAQILLKF